MSRWGLCGRVALVLLAGVIAQAETDWDQMYVQWRQLWAQGRLREAKTLLLDGWRKAERNRADPEIVALLCHHLGITYMDLGQYAESERFFARALHDWELTSPPHPRELVTTANGLATLYVNQRRIARAEALFSSFVAAVAETLDRNDTERARWRCNWASVLFFRGNLAEAERLYRDSLQSWEKAFGPDHMEVVSALNNLAAVYAKMNRRNDALRCLERVRSISERTGMRLEQPLVNLADFYVELHRDQEAEVLYRQALGNIEAMRGPDHPWMAEALEQYAAALRRWKRKGEAAKLHRRAKDILAQCARNAPAGQPVHVSELALR